MVFQFIDIHKPTTDLLTEDYSNKLSLKCKKSAGPVNITIESSRNPSDGTLSTKIGSKFNVCGVKVDKLQLTQDTNCVLETSLGICNGTTIGFNGNSKTSDLNLEYNQKNITASAVLDVQEFRKFHTQAMVSLKDGTLSLGADAHVDLNASTVSSVNIGMNYRQGSLFASMSTMDGLNCCQTKSNLNFLYQVNPKLSLASNSIHSCEKPLKEITLGGLYKSSYADFKLKANCCGRVSGCMMKEMAPNVNLTLSGSVSVSEPTKVDYGLGLTI